jgi:hypothetical protein
VKRSVKQCGFSRVMTSPFCIRVGAGPACQIMTLLFALSGTVSTVSAEPPQAMETQTAAAQQLASPEAPPGGPAASRQYTYSWLFSDATAMKPRGGTTEGPAVTISEARSAGFLALQ